MHRRVIEKRVGVTTPRTAPGTNRFPSAIKTKKLLQHRVTAEKFLPKMENYVQMTKLSSLGRDSWDSQDPQDR
jgi:hypothetical protein